MSYILDAIKKSEAERNQGITPGALGALPSPSRSGAPARIIAAVVTLNIAAIAAWWWWQNVAPLDAVEREPASAGAFSTPASSAAPPVATLDATPVATPAPPERQELAPRPQPQPAIPRQRPEAPSFSTHVYADDPDLRAVTLNGQRLTEGDLVEPGMRIVEITETGVVVDYHGERFEFDVLQDWRT